MGVGDRASCPPTSGMTSHGCQTRVPRKRDGRGNYGKRCMPDRKRNVTPGWFPVRDSPGASLPPLVQTRNVTSHCPGACRPKSLRLLLSAYFLGSAPGWLQAPLRGPLSPQEHALGLPASASSDKESYIQNPELCSVNRTAKSQRPSGLSLKTPAAPLVPWRVAPSPPTSGLLYPTEGTKSLCS